MNRSAAIRPGAAARAVACVLVLLLAACGRTPEPAPPVVSDAPTSSDQAFALLRAGADTFEGRPALLLEFSRPLAPAQPFDTLIVVRGPGDAVQSGGWVLAEDGRTLRFPYVQADQTYALQFDPGITAADGQALGASPPQSVYSGELPPQLGFASQGSVLPLAGTEGLPLMSVNVAEADVEFFRVREEHYSEFFQQFMRNGQRGWWELNRIGAIAESVYANRFALTSRSNERSVSFLPVQSIAELRDSGLYFAVMKRPGQFDSQLQSTHFVVSDLGLHARSHADRLWVHLASLGNGRPRSGVQADVLDDKGRRLATGVSDENGQLALDYRADPSHVLVARSGRELAVLPFRQAALDLSEFEVGGRAQTALDVYAWSGRDLFRPGETLQVSALLRDHDGRLPAALPPLFAVLKQPDGRALGAELIEPGALGYYSITRAIAEDAPTGRWTLEFRSDPEHGAPIGQFAFRVEEFLPERLKLSLDSSAERLAPGDPLTLAIAGDYLYGAPAGGNRFTAELLYKVDLHPVASRPDFFFGDPTFTLPEGPQPGIDVTLPGDGRLEASIDLLPEITPTTPVQVRVAGSLFESGGRAVRRSVARTVWPAEALVGLRPLFDPAESADSNSTVGFELIRADAAGNLVPAEGLKVELVRERRDYRWTWVEGSGWSSDYNRHDEVVETREVAADGQRALKLEFPVEWGEYRVQVFDPASGLTMRYPFTAGWSWNDGNRGVDARPDRVKLALDKTGYRAGDTLTVTVTAPHQGPGLLLVESDRLLHSQPIEVTPGAEFTLTVGPDWERHDIYITALVFRPASSSERTGPQRAVGVVHVPIERGDRGTELAIEAPEITRPGESLEITLTAPALAGQTAFAVVEAVDQGILALTGYPLPDPNAHFLARRAFGVEARDVYGRVIEPMVGERARLRYGGDAMLAALPQARRPTARVQTVALHSGPVAFDAAGRAQVRFEAPDFNGALRIAALAYSDSRFARAEREALVRAPLVLEVSTPRAMAGGDQARLAIELQNLSGAPQRYRVQASAEAPLAVDGGAQTVELADGERRSVAFPLRALPGQDVGRFSVRSESAGGEVLERHFELAVRPAWPAERRSAARVQDGAGELLIGRGLLDGLQPAASRVQISLSTVPPIPFVAAAQGLIGYPMGCIEQTSSRLWPLIWLDEATTARFGLTLDPAERQRMVNAGLARIASMQLESGVFSFWPGDGSGEPQMTAHVAELLLEAREAGHTVPPNVLERALDRLNEDLLAGGGDYYGFEHSEHLRFAANAHAGYVLARAGRAPLGALRALHDHERGRSLTALPLVQLGLALHLQGDAERAEVALTDALAKASERPEWLGDYGSKIRDEALLLALLHEQQRATPAVDARIIDIARELRGPEASQFGLSTQEQLAVFRLGRQLLARDSAPLAGSLQVGERRIELPAVNLYALTLEGEELRRGVRATLGNSGQVWIAEDAIGTPAQAPAPVDAGLRVQRAWYRMDGTLFEGGTLKEGDSLIARLTVEAKEEVPDALVTDLLPGGLEVENLALGDTETLAQLSIEGEALSERYWQAEVRHEEYRDDRYVAAVKLYSGQVARLYYLIRAVSPGRYTVPPPFVEDMYRPRLRSIGRTEPASIEVTPP